MRKFVLFVTLPLLVIAGGLGAFYYHSWLERRGVLQEYDSLLRKYVESESAFNPALTAAESVRWDNDFTWEEIRERMYWAREEALKRKKHDHALHLAGLYPHRTREGSEVILAAGCDDPLKTANLAVDYFVYVADWRFVPGSSKSAERRKFVAQLFRDCGDDAKERILAEAERQLPYEMGWELVVDALLQVQVVR